MVEDEASANEVEGDAAKNAEVAEDPPGAVEPVEVAAPVPAAVAGAKPTLPGAVTAREKAEEANKGAKKKSARASSRRGPPIEFRWTFEMTQEELRDQDAVKSLKEELPADLSTQKLYYTPSNVARHNSERDCWVSLLGKVFDLTPLIASSEGSLMEPLTAFAGQDLSHWFDPETKDLRTRIDPVTLLRVYHTPHGRFLHVPPPEPVNDFNTHIAVPWWQDDRYIVGYLSSKPRKIRIVNALTKDEHTMEVCGEESIKDIRSKYLVYNQHAESYVWKRLGRLGESSMVILNLDSTLEENGIPDESEEYNNLGIDEEFYIPCIMIYFKDDLTAA